MSFNYNIPVVDALNHTSDYARSDPRAFADGIYGGTGADHMAGPAIVLPDGTSVQPQWARGGANAGSSNFDQGVQQTNTSTNYHSAQNVLHWRKGDTAAGLPTFQCDPGNTAVRTDLRKMSYVMFGVTALNQMLHYDPEMRRTYGASLHSTELRRAFRYIGMQQHRQTQLDSGVVFNQETNMYIRGRARVPNLWLAASTKMAIAELDVLYLVLRRKRFHAADALRADTWNSTAPAAASQRTRKRFGSARPDGPCEDETAKRSAYTREEVRDARSRQKSDAANIRSNTLFTRETSAPASVRANATADVAGYAYVFSDALAGNPAPCVVRATDALTVASQPDQSAGGDAEYYWSWDPYVSHDRSPPPVSVYCGDRQGDPNNQFVGDYLHIGQVLHVSKGMNNPTRAQVTLARDALYTKIRSDDYLEPLRLLDEVEIMVRMGRV